MKDLSAIVYTSNAGHTAKYARMLGQATGLPVYTLEQAKRLAPGTPILYMGWLMASQVKGCAKAAKQFDVRAVCAVGLCDTGTAVAEVRKANALPEAVPVFTVQGGMERKLLQGPYKLAINLLTRAMASKKNRTCDEERMLQLLMSDRSMVVQENLTAVLQWLQET